MNACSIHLDSALKKTLEDHSRKCSPNESCAILFGAATAGTVSVDDAALVENADASPTSFTMSSDDLIAAYGSGKNIVGIFHSHPSSAARPSETDKKFMALNPVVWLIHSGVDGAFHAFVLEDGNVREIATAFA